MFSTYAMSLLSPAGATIYAADLDANSFQALSYARSVNGVGAASISLPYSDAIWNACGPDTMLEIWRKGSTGASQRPMSTVWLLCSRKKSLTPTGERTMVLNFTDALGLLSRYIVMAASTDPLAVKTSLPAETLIKQVVSEQLLGLTLAGASTGRAPASILSAYIAVEPDAGRGYATISGSYSYQGVLATLQAVAQTSAQLGSYLAFDFAIITPLSWEFCVYPNQRGIDRSETSAKPLYISPQAGTLGSGEYTEDFASMASYVLCAGQSTDGAQTTGYAIDSYLEALGPFAHREGYVSSQQTIDYGSLTAQAIATLRTMRPVRSLTAVVNQVPGLEFGVDFDFGDLITVQFDSQVMPVHIEGISVTVDPTNGETVTTTMQYLVPQDAPLAPTGATGGGTGGTSATGGTGGSGGTGATGGTGGTGGTGATGGTGGTGGTYNVMDYGAARNGTTDDAGAFRSALAAASAAGGGTVYAPAGTYNLGSGVANPEGSIYANMFVPSNCSLTGDGIGQTILLARGTTSCNCIGVNDATNVTIADAEVQINAAYNGPDGTTSQDCIKIGNSSYVTVNNCKGSNAYIGSNCIGSNYITYNSCQMVSCQMGFCSYIRTNPDSLASTNVAYNSCTATSCGATSPNGLAGFAFFNQPSPDNSPNINHSLSYSYCVSTGSNGEGFYGNNADVVSYDHCQANGSTDWGWSLYLVTNYAFTSCTTTSSTSGVFRDQGGCSGTGTPTGT